MLSLKDVLSTLPPSMKGNISQQLVDDLNNVSADPMVADNIKDNFLSYTNVMLQGKWNINQYLDAIKYVSYKVMGQSNQRSYALTFPARYQRLKTKGCTEKEISSFVSAYNTNKLVNLIVEQSVIPSWLLNQAVYQDAINVQVDLMNTSGSDKVRSDAANSLLTHLKRPEAKEINLNIGASDNSGMNELKDTIFELARQQQKIIEAGIMTTKEVAHQKIIEHKAEPE
ncbi:MAG: hypothetical protein COA63_014050 [Methylophaga sp.]|nr:hypothetical protein [Methylophaga sp.]